jgi:hypothetical protein
MKGSTEFIIIMAVVVTMAALSGCTSTSSTGAYSPPAVQVQSTPAITYTSAPGPAVTSMPASPPVPAPDAGAVADKAFADAAKACFSATPVVSDVTTQLAFTTCIQNTPDPKGLCAVNYKDNILKATKDDPTSAGYSRENKRIPLIQDAYSGNMSYNTRTDTVEACSPLPLAPPM